MSEKKGITVARVKAIAKKYAELYAGEGATAWGDITGTLTDQTDLQAALDDKVDSVDTADWDTAYSWGDHASGGYAAAHSHPYLSNTTTHNDLSPDADEHIDWSVSNAKDIHADNYTAGGGGVDWTLASQGIIHASNYVDNDTTQTSVTGNAGSADQIDVNPTSVNASFRIVFRNASDTGGYTNLFQDTGTFYYNPSTNRLTVPNITATLTGSSTSCTGNAASASSVSWSNVTSKPTIPTNNNQLTNGAGYTSNTGDMTQVLAGTGMTGGGSAGSVTITHANNGTTNLGLGGSWVLSLLYSSTLGHISSMSRRTMTPSDIGAASASDIRLKDVIDRPDNLMDAVNNWDVIRYTLNEKAHAIKENPFKVGEVEIGISAQSVDIAHPELTMPLFLDREYMTIKYERLTAVLAGALQEKDKEIQELKERMIIVEKVLERLI